MKKTYLLLIVILISVGTTSAFAINITLGGTVDITQILNMMGNRITNVGTPTQASDAATKSYVDSAPGTDTLALLGCTTNQVARFDGSVWVCQNDQVFANKNIPRDNTITSIDTDVSDRTSLTIGIDGLPIISYYESTNMDLMIVHCTNPTCSSFDTPIILDSSGDVGEFNAIAIGTDGFPVITYVDATDGNLNFIHCTNITCSSSNNPVALDSIGSFGAWVSITIGTDGFPIIAYQDDNDGAQLKIAHCTTITCTGFGNITILDGTGATGSNSITIGTDGFPIISYNFVTSDDLRVVHCTNTACTSSNVPSAVDTTSAVGENSSIVIGDDGLPIISYYKINGGELRVGHCVNISCTSFDTITIVDTEDDTGFDTSMAIGADDLPVISYRDGTSGDLKFVHCTNPTCTSSDPPIRIDSADNVGRASSINLGTDGLPIISYVDSTNSALKVVKCGNERCIPNWTR